MRPIWLFETDVFGETAEPLKAEIRRQGFVCSAVRQQLLTTNSFSLPGNRRLADQDCVIACGSYPFVRFIQLNRRWVPGTWCSAENLDCTSYYVHFGRYLLNQRHMILPGVEAIRQAESIFSTLGQGDEVFIRPSGCQKLFTGRKVNRASFADVLGPSRYDPQTLVVVAAPRIITREWRLVVAEGTVIAGSQYLANGVIEINSDFPQEVYDFACEMLTTVRWRPDELFMMDLCESEGRLFLVELNSFSSSALYRCDFKTVVAIASGMAERAWKKQSDTDVGTVQMSPLTESV